MEYTIPPRKTRWNWGMVYCFFSFTSFAILAFGFPVGFLWSNFGNLVSLSNQDCWKIKWLYPLGRVILWEGHGLWAGNKIWANAIRRKSNLGVCKTWWTCILETLWFIVDMCGSKPVKPYSEGQTLSNIDVPAKQLWCSPTGEWLFSMWLPFFATLGGVRFKNPGEVQKVDGV